MGSMTMEKKIKTILIANRGEIACRIMRTCRLMGIQTIALYADDEALFPHVEQADQSVSLGSGALSETYLNQEKIIDIAKKYGADAIHPGYGFLSERASFVKKVEAAGLIFIGPTAGNMEQMGDKYHSKLLAAELKLPLIPGHHGENQESAHLRKEAEKVGLPLLIKASAGGGGKGMRIVRSMSEFDEALEGCKREAKNSFGDDVVLIERYIEKPHHIEIQVLCDQHGNFLYLGERECSIQRRYQKVIEESPSPFMTESLRKAMGEASVKLCQHMQYRGVGTIEFIVDEQRNFYFLEMNTRLQVEHPVTEMVTGLDLVEWQIRVANREKLSFTQDDIKLSGHALEVRVYSENPDQQFLPTDGTFTKIGALSAGLEGVRVDTGLREGLPVLLHYDPMVAKVITHDTTRKGAIIQMDQALRELGFLGVKTNLSYVIRVLKHEDFCRGSYHTGFLKDHEGELLRTKSTQEEKAIFSLAHYLAADESCGKALAGQLGWRNL
jgi:3-methylcrotonyl-CoA carboxylase alpha subunit